MASKACEIDINNNSKSVHFKSTAHKMKYFDSKIKKDLIDKNSEIDNPNFNHLDNKVEVFEYCMQYFHRAENKCENKRKFF